MHEWTRADLIGAHAALDFINTVADAGKSRQETRLATWNDYLRWLSAARLQHLGKPRLPRISQPATLARIHALREAGYAVLHALACGAAPGDYALATLQGFIRDAYRHGELLASGDGLRWQPGVKDREPHLHRLVLLIDDLLRSGELPRLRECARCTWLFLDTGRGPGRKWCDMRKCGNRQKSASFRLRHSVPVVRRKPPHPSR